MDKGGGQAHQICSFLCEQRIWSMSNSKTHREHMMEDLMEEAGEMGLGAKPASLCVAQHLCYR